MKKINRNYSSCFWPYLFIAPTMIGLFFLNILPIFQSFYLSLCESGDFGASRFVGLKTIKLLLNDNEVWQATLNTLVYAAGVVPFSVFLSLVFAVILNNNIKFKSVYRVIFFIPVISTPAAVAMVWRWLYNSEYGLINYVLSLFNIGPVSWLISPDVVMISMVIVGVWTLLGYNIILFLAGLQGISNSYYEAADIDGAGKISQFFRITIPLVSPTTFFVTILTVISSLQIFDFIYMMIDKTNPVFPHAQTLVVLFYRHGFQMLNASYASAIVLLLFLIIMLITAAQFFVQRKWVHYN